MDPKTGAIKKKGSPLFYYPDSDDPAKAKCSLALKIKHVCSSCYALVELQINNREVFPLWKRKDCFECSYNGVKYEYALICSICSRLLQICCRCLNEYNEYGPFKPLNLLVLYNKPMFDKFQMLNIETKRRFLHFVFRRWKHYEKLNKKATMIEAKANLISLREDIHKKLDYQISAIEAFNNIFS